MKSQIVEAVGTAVTRKTDTNENPVEVAMRKAVLDAYQESDAIWARDDIDVNEKRRLIAVVISDDAIRNRTLEARTKVRKALRSSS